ncbi:MAG: hypothetical protein Q9191_002479 [Dirinaria sp. TL-2023a]
MAVAHLLHQIWGSIQEAIQSINNAYPLESAIYYKFFNGVDPRKVQRVRSEIAAGSDVSFDGRSYPPHIICANPRMPQLANSWALCQQSARAINAMWMRDTPWIYLCPRSFHEQEFPVHENCVDQPSHGAFSTGQGLAQTQFSHLFHELVHLYLGEPALKPEMYGIWAVRDLPASESSEAKMLFVKISLQRALILIRQKKGGRRKGYFRTTLPPTRPPMSRLQQPVGL